MPNKGVFQQIIQQKFGLSGRAIGQQIFAPELPDRLFQQRSKLWAKSRTNTEFLSILLHIFLKETSGL